MTEIRAEVSKKNRYWISKHRYYELKHFCMQYKEWEREYLMLSSMGVPANSIPKNPRGENLENRFEKLAIKMASISSKMDLVKHCCKEADEDLGNYIFKAATEDYSFVGLKMKFDIPCERDMYYDRYRRFFWLLSKERD